MSKFFIFFLFFMGVIWTKDCAHAQNLSVQEAKNYLTECLNSAKADASAIDAKSEKNRRGFAHKWLERYFNVEEMARQSLLFIMRDLLAKNGGDREKTAQEIDTILDCYIEKLKTHLITKFATEKKLETFINSSFTLNGGENIDDDTVYVTVTFNMGDSNNTTTFAKFYLIKIGNKIYLINILLEGAFDLINNLQAQAKGVYDQNNGNLEQFVAAFR